jgi:glc operon protein GlcG
MSHLIDRRTIASDLAVMMIAKAIEAAEAPMGVAVVGSSGELIAYRKADGAPLVAETIARDKAYTAVALGGMPTSALAGALDAAPTMVHGLTNVERIMIFGGGVPVHIDGQLVGAVGCSGGSAEQDAAAAQSAVDLAVSLIPSGQE